jgi:putative DNA primase/helicase
VTKGVKLVRASEVEPRRVHSLFDKLLPLRAISTLAGPGGLGKSTLTIELGAKMTRGEMQGSKLAHSVMFVSTEDTASEVLIPRLMLADADMDRVFFPRLTQEGKPSALTLPDDMDVIERAVKKGKVRLVVLDPLFSMVSGSVNSNSVHHVRRVLAPLSELANRHALIIIAVVHTNKGVSLALLVV